MRRGDYGFRYAEKNLYDYPMNCARIDRLTERLAGLYASSTAKAQGYEATDRSSGPGDPVAARAMTIVAMEDEIKRLREKTEPIRELMRVLDAPFALDGTPLESLAKVARMHYFARMPKAETAARLGVDRRTVYNMRVRLVELAIKYMELRTEWENDFPILNGNP